MEKSPNDGVVRIDDAKCVGCGLCTLACPYGGIYYDTQAQKSFKCDQCNGDPKCIEACPYQAITYITNRPVLSYLQEEEELVSPGVGACRGCLAELALRFTLRVLGKDTVLFTSPGCVTLMCHGFDTRPGTRVARVKCLLDNVAAEMTGVKMYYDSIGRDVKLASFVGDGATVDIGFQALSGAAERGENFIYICNDNEGYMNTGVQRSGSTPFAAQTATTPVGEYRQGKEQESKYLPLLMLFHGAPYVATATIAYPEDYAQKLVKAMNVKDGMVYIHLFLPCITGWGIAEDEGLDAARLAVETNYFPLWEAEHGRVRLTRELTNPKPIQEYTRIMNKYAHLTAEDLKRLQESVNGRYNMLKGLASMPVAWR